MSTTTSPGSMPKVFRDLDKMAPATKHASLGQMVNDLTNTLNQMVTAFNAVVAQLQTNGQAGITTAAYGQTTVVTTADQRPFAQTI